jgi:hypothetical protein
LYAEQHHPDAHVLGCYHALPKVLVARQQIRRGDATFARESRKVSVDQRIDALLLLASEPAQTQLDARQASHPELIKCGHGVPCSVVPVRPQNGQRTVGRGEGYQVLDQALEVAVKSIALVGSAAKLSSLGEEIASIDEETAAFQITPECKRGLL